MATQRMRRLKVRDVVGVLWDRATLLQASLKGEKPTEYEFQETVANHAIRSAIKEKSIAPILSDIPIIRAVALARIQAFILEYSKRRDDVVARIPRDASDEDVLAAALSVLLPKGEGGFQMSNREIRKARAFRGLS